MNELWDTKSLYELGVVVNTYELWDTQINFGIYHNSNSPKLWVDCSDFFMWACADGEDLTPFDVSLLEQAAKDLKDADEFAECYAFDLWVCRKRKMLPMKRWMVKEKLSAQVRALFEAVGENK